MMKSAIWIGIINELGGLMKLIEDKNRFYVNDEEGYLLAEVTWIEKNGMYYVDHTYVNESLRGQGIAGKLVDVIVDKAKQDGVKIIPVCPYVVKKFDNDKEKYAFIDGRN